MVIMDGDCPGWLTALNEDRLAAEHLRHLRRNVPKGGVAAVAVEMFGAHEVVWAPLEKVKAYEGPGSNPNARAPKNRGTEYARGISEIQAAAERLASGVLVSGVEELGWLDGVELGRVEGEMRKGGGEVGAEEEEEAWRKAGFFELQTPEQAKRTPAKRPYERTGGWGRMCVSFVTPCIHTSVVAHLNTAAPLHRVCVCVVSHNTNASLSSAISCVVVRHPWQPH
jgi:hypothetical protein